MTPSLNHDVLDVTQTEIPSRAAAARRGDALWAAGCEDDATGLDPTGRWDLAFACFLEAQVPEDELPVELVLHVGLRAIERGDFYAAIDLVEPNLSRLSAAVEADELVEIHYELAFANLMTGRDAAFLDHLDQAATLIKLGTLTWNACGNCVPRAVEENLLCRLEDELSAVGRSGFEPTPGFVASCHRYLEMTGHLDLFDEHWDLVAALVTAQRVVGGCPEAAFDLLIKRAMDLADQTRGPHNYWGDQRGVDLMAWYTINGFLEEAFVAAEGLRCTGSLDASRVEAFVDLCVLVTDEAWTSYLEYVPADPGAVPDLVADELLNRQLGADQVERLAKLLGHDPGGGPRPFVLLHQLYA